jgi:surfeit locus 1 family protein
VPHPPVPAGPVSLEGMAVDPHSRFLELSRTLPQGRVWQNLDFDRYAKSEKPGLQPVLLLQTSDIDDGLKRNWPRPDTGVSMHVSYAIQWYSLATTLVVLWLVMNVKRHRDDDA